MILQTEKSIWWSNKFPTKSPFPHSFLFEVLGCTSTFYSAVEKSFIELCDSGNVWLDDRGFYLKTNRKAYLYAWKEKGEI